MTEADVLGYALQAGGALALALGVIHENRMRKVESRLHDMELDLAKNYITEVALNRALDAALKPVNECLAKIVYWAERHNGGLPLGSPMP